MARIRSTPEDFQVEELPLFVPSGDGGHTFLWVEKRDTNTEHVAHELARSCGVGRRDVGYAGRKDRRSVSRQHFSVPDLDPARALELPLDGARVLAAARHPHKLRTGQLAGNRFTIVVREVTPDAAAAAVQRIRALARDGVPNRFGAQRFGRDGDNVARARGLLAGELRDPDRRAARFWLSALQAAVFNAVLAERPLALDRLENGDVAVVHATGGLFRVEDALAEGPRAARFEISATGPIPALGRERPDARRTPCGPPAARERAVLAAHGLDRPGALRLPRGLRARGGRRPLRVRPAEVDFSVEEAVLKLRFVLPPGSYASVFLQEVFGPDTLREDGEIPAGPMRAASTAAEEAKRRPRPRRIP